MRASALLVMCTACSGDKSRTPDTSSEAGGVVETGDPSSTPQTWDPRFDSVAQAFQDELDSSGVPGVTVAILEGSQIVFSAGFGSKDPELSADEAPMRGTTLMRIGSVNKMLTAAATLTEVDSGALALDQPLIDVLPDLDFLLDESWAPELRLEHVLTHQGGFYDWTPLEYGEDDSLLESITYQIFDDYLWLMVEPGTFWNYANANYSMVGLMGQQSSGILYRELVDERIWTPLGMERSFFLAEEVEADGDFAYAETLDWTGETTETVRVEPDTYDDGWSRPAGFAWSSVEDLLRFADFLLHGDETVLSPELQQAMSTPQVDTQQFLDLEHYGYGLIINQGFFLGEDWVSDTLISHSGAIPGYSASLYILPEQDMAMAILSNADGSYFGESVVAALPEVAALNMGPMPDLWPDELNLDDYVGSYADPWNVGDFEVSSDGTHLQVSMPDLDALGYAYESEMAPYLPDNFIFEVSGSQMLVTFIRDESGEVKYWRNRYFVGEKVDETADNDSEDEASALPRRSSLPGVEGMLQATQRAEPSPALILWSAGD
jgi:CubicO group peptidase (beta-lactamase class C family)